MTFKLHGIRVYPDISKSIITNIYSTLCRDPLFSTRGAYIIRKNFPFTQIINNEIMWLHAHFGLERDFDIGFLSGKRNNGIWAANGGACELSEPSVKCELPTGSKLYSWANRDKVLAKNLTEYFINRAQQSLV